MEIVVSDTNIFIDIMTMELLEEFCSCFSVHTVDFVVSEIQKAEQMAEMERHIQSGTITVKRYTSEEMLGILDFHATRRGNVSLADCAVWRYAQSNGYTLATGNRQLRTQAEMTEVRVVGILFILKNLVDSGFVIASDAARRLQKLVDGNVRLPRKDVAKLLEEWR